MRTHCKSRRKGDAKMEQRIACSVLIRTIYLTWEQDTRPFLRALSAQGMELDLTQANAVAALTETESGELSLKALERSLHMSQSAVSRMAVRLAKAGYVEIRPDGSDRRVKWVCLTEKGRQCGAYMEDLVAEAEEQLLQGLTPGERLLLRELLERILENSVRCCLQKDGSEKSQKRTESENEKE